MSDQALAGAVALVTGASSGIGEATARRLVREGAVVVLVARRGDRLARIADDIVTQGGHAIAMPADITEPAHAYRAVEDAHNRLGRLDVLVNSAGVMVLDSALHAPIEDWDRMIALNVSAMLHVTHAAIPYLIDAAATSSRQVADLVNVGSPAGRVARPGGSVYHLTEFGLNGFTESLRQELAPEGVRVGLVAPGVVDRAAYDTTQRVQSLRPETIADSIAYVVSQERRVAINELSISPGGQKR